MHFKNYPFRLSVALFSLLFFSTLNIAAAPAEPAGEKPPEKVPEANGKPKADGKGRKKQTIKMADDKEESAPPERDPSTYQLSNKRLMDDYTDRDLRPFDRGEHILISAFMGGIGGGVVGGMVGLYGYDKNNETNSLNTVYTFAGIGAGAGAAAGILTTFFERGKVEQFAIGKFLLKYSWYGAIGGGLLGGGIGLIPYSSSKDYSDILRYAGYGSGIGLAAGLTLFFIDLPEHLKMYSYRRDDQQVIVLAWRF